MPLTFSRSSLFRLLIPMCLLSALTVVPPLASAMRDNRDADVFSGSCHFSGTLTFDPALRNDFQFVRNFTRADGPCDGTFTNQKGRSRTLSGEPVRWYAEGSGRLSCGGPAP